MVYLIRPTDRDRRKTWLNLIGHDALPLVDPAPRLGIDGDLVYDVSLAGLSDMRRARLAAFIARREKRPYIEVLQQVNGGAVAISALGCELIEETAVSRPDPSPRRGRGETAVRELI